MPDNISKYPYKPFPKPVPPIPVIGLGDMCITFDKKYLPYILGALKSLEAPQTYQTDQETAVLEARQLLSKFIIHDPCESEGNCVEFALSSNIISWEPKNPFTEAGEIPDGYIAPPFYVLVDDAATITLGLQPNDVISGWFSLPVFTPALGEGLARFRVTVQGACTVELHLLAIPSGGLVWIVDDDNPLTLTSVDLNRDLVSLPPETDVTVIQERTFTDAGEHHIDVSFLAQFNDSAVFLGYGGGIRKVVVCGGDDLMLDVRQNPFSPCILDKRSGSGEWQLFANMAICVPTALTVKQWRVSGGVSQVSLDGGVTFYDYPDGQEPDYGQSPPDFPVGADNACLAAKNIVAVLRSQFQQIHDGLSAGAVVISLVALLTAAILVFVTAGAAAPLILALVSELYAIGAVGIEQNLTAQFWEDIECEIYTRIGSDGLFDSAEFASFHDAILGYGDAGTILSALVTLYGPTGLNNMRLGANITSCNNEPCDDTKQRVYDFEFSPYPMRIAQHGELLTWESTPLPAANWQLNKGWVGVWYFDTGGQGWKHGAAVEWILESDVLIQTVKIDYKYKPDAVTFEPSLIMRLEPASGSTGVFVASNFNGQNTSPEGSYSGTLVVPSADKLYKAGTRLFVFVNCNQHQGTGAKNETVLGYAQIKKMTIT